MVNRSRTLTEADVDEDLIARFAHPVITERGHVLSSKHARRTCWSAASVSPSKMPSAHGSIGAVDPLSIRWDAWRRSDGTWSVVAAYPAAQGDRIATFTYNPRDDSISAVDDEAMWLLEQASAPQPQTPPLPPTPPTNINDGPRQNGAPQRHQSAQQRAHQFHRIPARNGSRQGPGISRILPLERRNAGSLRRRRVTLLAAPRVAALRFAHKYC